MSIRIDISRYELVPRTSTGPLGGRATRRGALLRWIAEDGNVGYSDCFPWPEHGDENLETQLSSLRAGTLTRLTRRGAELARIDMRARADGVSLFANAVPVESHFLVADMQDAVRVANAYVAGFRAFKLKVSRDQQWEEVAALFGPMEGCRLRLDFNCTLRDSDSTIRCWDGMPDTLRSRVEWVEDPFPFDAVAWREIASLTGMTLAFDHGGEGFFAEADVLTETVGVWVVKPAVQDPERLFCGSLPRKVCVTSYLDHPLGQVVAYWYALHARKCGVIDLQACGLVSHSAYVSNDFSEALGWSGPFALPVPGTGFGFDEILAGRSWSTFSIIDHDPLS